MDIIALLNTIRDNASASYQERVPEATKNNIESIQAVMLGDDPVVANEFMASLLNKVVKTQIINKSFQNPLKALKKGTKPLGDTVEEIYNNFIKGEAFDGTGNVNALMGRKLPDTKSVYHRMNRKDKYTITVSPERLAKAFASYEALESYVASLINVLYNSSELDEFILTKQLIKTALDNNAVKVVTIADPLLAKENAEGFIKTVKTTSGLMEFPKADFCAYTDAQKVDDKEIITFSRKNEQVLILDTATNVGVAVDVLASIFNMSVAEFNETRKIVIDNFPDPDIRGALVDEQFFQIFDDAMFIKSFDNGESVYTNYFLHVWQTLAYSILVNAVVFKVGSDADKDGAVEEFGVTYTLADGVTSSNKRKSVTEGGSYSTTLRGAEGKSVTVNMGGSAVTGAYDSASGKVAIDSVTGDIVITVA